MTGDLSDDTRSLIRDALAEERRPGHAHRNRLRRSVLARAATGGVVTLVGASVAKASGHSLLALVVNGVGLGFGAGLVLAGAAQLAFAPKIQSDSHENVAQPAPVRSVQVTSVGASVPDRALPVGPMTSAEPIDLDGSSQSKRRFVESAPSAAANAASGSRLRAELDLMAQVQGALRDGHGAHALELIARYDAQHPSGMLQNERLAAEVFAACETGDRARAGRVARHFLARDSVSALAARVKNACLAAGDEAP
jgi:hypothetical protein